MAYIGRNVDKISNVEVLDNITFDGSSSYTLQKSSVNFTPSSANTLLLSIDGVVQANNFSVSGSTIDFGTAVAGTSTCNFVLHYGVGLITAPSDGSVTTAKIVDNAVTLAKMASGTDGNIISYDASGNPVAVATGNDGQVLTSTGAGSPPAFETLPAGGITEVDMWRLTTYYTGSQNPINANWERADTSGFSYKGTGLTQSSGVFSFPSTGFWYIDYNWQGNSQTDRRNVGAGISATEDNSSYSDLAYSSTFLQRTESDATYISVNTNVIFKVDNVSTHKIRFFGGATSVNANPDTNAQAVGFTCFKLTDI